MKLKMLIVSIFLVIFLTGCNANYSITIKNGNVNEKLSVIEIDINRVDIKDNVGMTFRDYAKFYGQEKDLITDYNVSYSQEECNENCVYYSKNFIEEDNKVGFELEHTFTIEEYTLSTIANELIPGFSSSYDGRYLTITSSNSWNAIDNYEYLDDFTISIETDYTVKRSNGKKDGNTYTWTISKGEIPDDRIYMLIDLNSKEESKKASSKLIYIFLIILIVLVIIASYFLIKKNKEQNDI